MNSIAVTIRIYNKKSYKQCLPGGNLCHNHISWQTSPQCQPIIIYIDRQGRENVENSRGYSSLLCSSRLQLYSWKRGSWQASIRDPDRGITGRRHRYIEGQCYRRCSIVSSYSPSTHALQYSGVYRIHYVVSDITLQ